MNRRGFLGRGLIGASALSLGGCKILDGANTRDSVLRTTFEEVGKLSYRTQRLIGGGHTLAPEYTQADIRQSQHPNGVTNPAGDEYAAMASNGFADYALTVTGLVDNPLTLSLADLMAMPAKTQITRHDCVEGWSCIAKWTGVPMGLVLDQAKPQLTARYAVFHCLDAIERGLSGEVKYYESIDLIDAYHPQTILAYGMNDAALPVANGAPLRVRVERQLGYKMAKYIHTIELVDSFAAIQDGHGSYWADRGYEWYAGI
jgi:DMSO/TMAO reductase YedYZ molybdopterin-dependent catalytic subunit